MPASHAPIEATRTEGNAIRVSCTAPLLYCVSGFIKDAIFHYHAAVDLPDAEFDIQMPHEPAPALLVMDREGREAGFLLID